MREAISRCALDLTGKVVLTEAATGAYVVTPVLAALAGAKRVYAVTRNTRYGTVAQVTAQTMELATAGGVASRLHILSDLPAAVLAEADIVTNSGHLRPLDGDRVRRMKANAVIPLMYEGWEFRVEDVDLPACAERGIRVAGTNERHPALGFFAYLGEMVVKLLIDAGVGVVHTRVLLLCDNSFGEVIRQSLASFGAQVDLVSTLDDTVPSRNYDSLVVASTPQANPVIGPREAAVLGQRWPGIVVVQYWGDIHRAALAQSCVAYWPQEGPAPGHMGVLPSALGPDPIIRLQAGGLKVGQVLCCPQEQMERKDWEFISELPREVATVR